MTDPDNMKPEDEVMISLDGKEEKISFDPPKDNAT